MSEQDSASESGESSSSITTETSRKTGKDDDTVSSDGIMSQDYNKAVFRNKILVLLVITLAAAASGVATFLFMKDQEDGEFKARFRDYGTELIDIAHQEAKNVYGALDGLSAHITSYVTDSGSSWPNVTIPHFELVGQSNNELTGAIHLSLLPLVKAEQRGEWEAYAQEKKSWIHESYTLGEGYPQRSLADITIEDNVFVYAEDGTTKVVQDGPGIQYGSGNYAPVWQQIPAPTDTSIINWDLLSHEVFARVYSGLWESRLPVITEILKFDGIYKGAVDYDSNMPHSFLLEPVYTTIENHVKDHERDDLVAFVVAVMPWDRYFKGILHEGTSGIVVVLHDTCGDHATLRLDGPRVTYLGEGDLHDRSFNHLGMYTEFAPFIAQNFSDAHTHCEYDVRIYPTTDFESSYKSSKPVTYMVLVIMVFAFTASVFIFYDYLVTMRQRKVMATAKRTNAIVTSLFPGQVRDQMMQQHASDDEDNNKTKTKTQGFGNKRELRNFLDEDLKDMEGGRQALDSKPIAEYFPDCTVMFADIAGFTAWSSVREPTQVFTLLENIFGAFDEIARKRRVFKVETIGDCYVAVVGLPEARADHALVMSRFARDCVTRMNDVTKHLEMVLGPGTGDLAIRIGLHSGPVTAGVLRGDKSRFQLYGDTVNAAAKIESGGVRNKIHLSETTAELLKNAKKEHWLTKRDESLVVSTGKQGMTTYWLNLKVQSGASTSSRNTGTDASIKDGDESEAEKEKVNAVLTDIKAAEKAKPTFDDRIQRLADWNSDLLLRMLKRIVARRRAALKASPNKDRRPAAAYRLYHAPGQTVIDEVKEIITLPEFDHNIAKIQEDMEKVELSEQVVAQVKDFVTIIASMYRDNPFHNFEHASHVTMSVVKLLSRIVAPEDVNGDHASLHDHTYGITSDPLTQFACVLAALIHDVDHCGVPNTQLVKEECEIAKKYKGKSVAEQNSVDLAWELLQDDAFTELRNNICPSEEEEIRFRELVVNSVLATDIMDKDLKAARNARWEKAFSEDADQGSHHESINRKATIVIEHLIQASDIAHTMQHWHVYRKWNERLFHELYLAFRQGRSTTDPSSFWAKGEIGFFDFYIIPLAKKLEDCGIFGVSSDEYLNYAQKNRAEWESKGEQVVEAYIEKFSEMYVDVKPSEEYFEGRASSIESRLQGHLSKSTAGRSG